MIKVNLNNIDAVKDFVSEMSKLPENVNVDLLSGRYVINAKSIMGVFSLDLSKPIDLRVTCENQYVVNQVYELCDKFLAL